MKEWNAEEINKLNLPFLYDAELSGDTRIVRLNGSFDQNTLPEIMKLIEALAKEYEANSLNIILDWERVENVDSSILAALVMRVGELKENHKRMGMINMTEKLSNLIELFKQSASFELFDSEEEAVKELG